MTYTAAAATGVFFAVVLDVLLLRTRLVLSRVFWCAYPIVFGFQLLSNGILTGRGVVLYRPSAITGVRLVHAPIEDLVFGFALVLATLSLWTFLKPSAASPGDRSVGAESGPPGASSGGPSTASFGGPSTASSGGVSAASFGGPSVGAPVRPSAVSPPGPGPSEPPAPRP